MKGYKVYKFGGAAVKDANGVRNLARIVNAESNPLVVVVSAMGKTTNALEKIIELYQNRLDFSIEVKDLFNYHDSIIKDLFYHEAHMDIERYEEFKKLFIQEINNAPTENLDADYDRIICYGELLSTSIISAYLHVSGIENKWKDARCMIFTSEDYREGKVQWHLTEEFIRKQITGNGIYITQGFIGSNKDGKTVTLGREGSDFSAAVIAACLNAESVTVWKDVDGILNADPRWYSKAGLLSELSYNEAVEQAFYGASIIHPKTIKPLENKSIPLYVRSFIKSDNEGTVIHKAKHIKYPPVLIRKTNLVLVTISSFDFSFIVEENLQEIFSVFSQNYAKLQIMENSALKFSACIKVRDERLHIIKEKLMQNYKFSYNTGVSLYTIRHYNDSIIYEITTDNEVLMEQKNRSTAWYVVR